ncbi:CotH kinase family protein, partial [Rhodococcus sp. CX]|uniref:CotH kinase family protein n=1 Tax=Rhodococcus sp. CX TaxID=2789880 RepID=UPI0018CCC8D7
MSGTNPAGEPGPRRRLVHRIPTSLRQHWKLLVVFVAFATIMATVFGGARIRPYIVGDATVIASEITENIAGTVDLFDSSVQHEVSLEITDAEYRDMITTFQKTGDKKWVTADLTIDGTFVDDVSVRLKGNSTLMGVRGDDARPGGSGFRPPEGMELPEGFEFPEDFDPGRMGGMMSSASEDDPTSLPLLISFDENVSGRAYQGMTELSVRPGTPVLNEAMALSLTAETGQPTQRYAYTVYSINDSATTTRLLLEHPDDGYANSLFDGNGYLYKADASSRFEYVDDDQSSYADRFKQINAVGSGNLQPIVNFLKWMDAASDEEFDAHLGDWVDVESFARYVATQNLLVNGDDMAGPGQNYYLWYDLGTEKFTVVSWDLNLAMQG